MKQLYKITRLHLGVSHSINFKIQLQQFFFLLGNITQAVGLLMTHVCKLYHIDFFPLKLLSSVLTLSFPQSSSYCLLPDQHQWLDFLEEGFFFQSNIFFHNSQEFLYLWIIFKSQMFRTTHKLLESRKINVNGSQYQQSD